MHCQTAASTAKAHSPCIRKGSSDVLVMADHMHSLYRPIKTAKHLRLIIFMKLREKDESYS